MHNYYNIIPSVLLDILIIFFLEGVVFYKFIFPMEKKLASDQLSEFQDKLTQKINATIQEYKKDNIDIQGELLNIQSGLLKTNAYGALDDNIRAILKQDIEIIVNNEKNYIEESSKYFLIIFLLTCAGFLVVLFIYYYICKYVFHSVINWFAILSSLVFIIIGIIGFEIYYFLYILLKKKINDEKIIKYFIEEILGKQ